MSSHKNNGEEMAWSSSTTHKVCAICLEELDMKAFPEQVHEGAAHDSNVCFECWRTHLADEVRTQRHDRIGCVECGASLHQTAVRRLASHDTFET